MSAVKAKKPKVTVVTKEATVEQPISVNNQLIHATDAVLKGFAVLAASNMLGQPQFAYQASQAGLVELSDVLFKYMSGQYTVVPAPVSTPVEGPTFG